MQDLIEQIIPVDKDHRIKVVPVWYHNINDYRWEIHKQKKWLFWWLSSSWEKNGSLLMRVQSETFRTAAIKRAEEIKNKFLNICPPTNT